MATCVCQKVQSWFEPWLIEPRGIGFEFYVSSRCESNVEQSIQHQTAHNHKPENSKESSRKEGFRGWSFLQALSNVTNSASQEHDKVYVHPMVKRSTSMLSDKSLEMCTESLGSETGSNMSENGDELISCLVSEAERSKRMPCFGVRKRWSGGSGSSFPPPLTTICGRGSGGSGVRVESQRVDGRLVLKALCVEAQQRCFMAERRDGRLRLHLLTNSSCSSLSGDGEGFLDDDEYITYHDDNDDDDDDDDDEWDYDDDHDDEWD